ncbi:MAG: hypothetical protein JW716_01300 [Candidatus Aenigmarchaeota archaeon]|nr:hypothetical protein [Candidatus Aenigmarchaeota archaeon]
MGVENYHPGISQAEIDNSKSEIEIVPLSRYLGWLPLGKVRVRCGGNNGQVCGHEYKRLLRNDLPKDQRRQGLYGQILVCPECGHRDEMAYWKKKSI